MSQSFIPEGNEQSLSDMPPTLNTEVNYRTAKIMECGCTNVRIV